MPSSPQSPPTAYINARLLNPASGLDAKGALLVVDGRIADLGPHLFQQGAPSGMNLVDCGGQCLAPGLIDIRVILREPGEEHKETIESASRAAAAGHNLFQTIDYYLILEFIINEDNRNLSI